MAVSVSCIGRMFLFIIIAAVLVVGSFILFPGWQYQVFGIGSPSSVLETDEAGRQIIQSLDQLEQALSDAGVSRDEIQRIMDQVDTETLETAVQESVKTGADTAGQLFDELKKRVDFGSADTEAVRNFFAERTKDIDFSRAFRELGEVMEQGVRSFADILRDAVSK